MASPFPDGAIIAVLPADEHGPSIDGTCPAREYGTFARVIRFDAGDGSISVEWLDGAMTGQRRWFTPSHARATTPDDQAAVDEVLAAEEARGGPGNPAPDVGVAAVAVEDEPEVDRDLALAQVLGMEVEFEAALAILEECNWDVTRVQQILLRRRFAREGNGLPGFRDIQSVEEEQRLAQPEPPTPEFSTPDGEVRYLVARAERQLKRGNPEEALELCVRGLTQSHSDADEFESPHRWAQVRSFNLTLFQCETVASKAAHAMEQWDEVVRFAERAYDRAPADARGTKVTLLELATGAAASSGDDEVVVLFAPLLVEIVDEILTSNPPHEYVQGQLVEVKGQGCLWLAQSLKNQNQTLAAKKNAQVALETFERASNEAKVAETRALIGQL